MTLNHCKNCGGPARFERDGTGERVRAVCENAAHDCGMATPYKMVSLEYGAMEEVAKIWNREAKPDPDEWPPWEQPSGAHNAYTLDAKVAHKNKHWRSLVSANVWEPGVSGWAEVTS